MGTVLSDRRDDARGDERDPTARRTSETSSARVILSDGDSFSTLLAPVLKSLYSTWTHPTCLALPCVYWYLVTSAIAPSFSTSAPTRSSFACHVAIHRVAAAAARADDVGAGEEDVDAASAPPRRARRRSAMLDAAARRRGVMRCDEASLDFVFCWS